MATLAAILVVVSYHMCEWRIFLSELRSPKSDVAILLTTFFLTVIIDLTVAISVGMVLAAFLFMKRMAEVTNVRAVTQEFDEDDADRSASEENGVRLRDIPQGVEVYEINGAFFFGAAETFKDTLAQIAGKPKGADNPHARRAASRFHGNARAQGRRPPKPKGWDHRTAFRPTHAATSCSDRLDRTRGDWARECLFESG